MEAKVVLKEPEQLNTLHFVLIVTKWSAALVLLTLVLSLE